MNTGRFIRYYLLLVLITATFGGLLYWVIYQQTLNSVVDEFKLESNNLINQLTKRLSLAFIEIHSDLRFLTEQRELHALFSTAQKKNNNHCKIYRHPGNHWHYKEIDTINCDFLIMMA